MLRRLTIAGLALLLVAGCQSEAPTTDVAVSNEPSTTAVAAAGPQVGDHLHLAYGISICGEWLEPLQDAGPDMLGIHAHGDGLIHVHPFSDETSGANAVLDRFADQVDMTLGDGELVLPDGSRFADGDDCGGTPGVLRALVWSDPDDPSPEEVTEDLGSIPARTDNGVIAIVFGPADETIDLPRWATNLQAPTRTEAGEEPLVS